MKEKHKIHLSPLVDLNFIISKLLLLDVYSWSNEADVRVLSYVNSNFKTVKHEHIAPSSFTIQRVFFICYTIPKRSNSIEDGNIYIFTLAQRLCSYGRCPLCDRCFGQQTNLDRHLKKHESDGPTILDEDRKRSRAAGMAAAAARPSGVHLLRPPTTGFYYADLAAVAAQHHHQQQQHRRAAIPELHHNISPILNSRLGMMGGGQSPIRSPAQSPSGSSSSDHDDAPMNKKARHLEIEEDEEEESAIESSPEEIEEDDDLANSKTIADEELQENSSKDEADAASEAGSHSSSGVSNASAPSSQGNAGVLSCEVTIHTDNKSPTLSPNPAAIIVVTPSS